MKKGIIAAIATITLSTASTFACDIHGKSGFMPENNLRIPVDSLASNGMTQEKFEKIIARVSDFYRPIVKQKGGNLVNNNQWTDETVNASAQRNGTDYVINMYGGLARHQLVTDDGFMLVVCHELGHHIGGAPRKTSAMGSSWAANEGQADYWGAMKCLRRVLQNDDNTTIMSNIKIDADVITKCEGIYKSANEVALCERTSMAGKSLAQLLGSLGGTPTVAFNTPDKSVVTKTFDAHPKAQCRLDTYFSGTLCDIALDIDVDSNNPKTGVCTKADGHNVGTRPLCWYKPTSAEL